jgi:hypothetical protein
MSQQFSSAQFYFDAFTVHFASAFSTTLVLYGLYAFSGRGVTVTVSQSIVLQVRLRYLPGQPLFWHDETASQGALCDKGEELFKKYLSVDINEPAPHIPLLLELVGRSKLH